MKRSKRLTAAGSAFASILCLCMTANAQTETCEDAGAASRTALVYSDRFLDHDTGDGHPERPERIEAIVRKLKAGGLWDRLTFVEPVAATEEQMLRAHTAEYLRQLHEAQENAPTNLDPDTRVGPVSYDVARLAAGGVLGAVDAVMTDAVDNAFVVSRPPGHHAFVDRASGFCLLNHVSVAAEHAKDTYGLTRILIVDWDVHHGNATQDAYYRDGSVIYFSTHQSPYYPFTGESDEVGAGAGLGTNFNVPLPAGSDGETILAAFRDVLVPAADKFKPELILISAGFDSHADDPLADFRLQREDFVAMTAIVRDLADRHSNGRLVSVLEGGYHLENVAEAVYAHVNYLATASDCGAVAH